MDIMNLSAITSLESVSRYQTSNPINPTTRAEKKDSFDMLLNSAMGLVKETNDYSNKAEEEEIKFALGISENTHDMAIAAAKASTALSYTVALRDKFMEAYKEIMQIQI